MPFGDKDQQGDFTLRHGDWVQFLLATDRRDQLQRATSISLLDETFQVSGEKREQGIVASLKEGFGFLRCVERNIRLFFHFTEVLDTVGWYTTSPVGVTNSPLFTFTEPRDLRRRRGGVHRDPGPGL